MKKCICSFVILIGFVVPAFSSASYEVCNLEQYSVVYINGILNTKSNASNGRWSLERELNKFNLLSYNNKDIAVRMAYNPSHLAGVGDGIKVLIQKTYDQMKAITGLDFDSREMLTALSDEVKEGRILFVPHSQGNFYANSMYGWIVAQEDGLSTDSMNMYNVASPTQLSAKKSKYILSKTDKVISGLVGSVGIIATPNANFKVSEDSNGHNFVDAYLSYGGERMVKDIKSQLEILKVDNTKDQTKPCIPKPEQPISHDLFSIFYKVADPFANVLKNTATLAASLSKGGLSSLASIVGLNRISNEGSESASNHSEDNVLPPSSIIEVTKPKDINNQIYTVHQEEKIVVSTSTKIAGDELDSILKRIEELKSQIDKQSKVPVKYYGSGLSYNSPTPIIPITINESTSTATSTQEQDPPAIPPAATTTASSTEVATSTPIKEVILGTNIIEAGEVKIVDTPTLAVSADNGNLIISEYYIGKEGEASWVEIFNTNKTSWVDTSHIVFMENNSRTRFPVTAIAPFSSVVFRSEGKAVHELLDNSIPVTYSLQNYQRVEGGFYIILQNDTGGEAAIDFTYYGGGYCNNIYSYSRSCERMITVLPGYNEEFWVRSRVVGVNIDNKIFNSVGKENMAWSYDTYEGRKVKGAYANEVINRGLHGYVSGSVYIPNGTKIKLDYNSDWRLIRTDDSLYGGGTETRVDVYGTLQPINTASILNVDGGQIYINVYSGGVLLRNIFSEIGVPIAMHGGVARIHMLNNSSIVNSGAVYISSYDSGMFKATPLVCDWFRNNKDAYSWNGGKIYVEGFDCGTPLSSESDNTEINYGISKTIDNRDPFTCEYYINDNGEMVCGHNDYPAPEDGGDKEDEDDTQASSSTLPTGGIEPEENSTSTNSGGNGINATSTDNTLPNNEHEESGEGYSSSTGNLPPAETASTTVTSTDNTLPNNKHEESGEGNSSSTGNLPPAGTASTTATSTDNGESEDGYNGGEVLGTSTSSPVSLGLTEEGCYNGTIESTINEDQRNATCGNGWAKRPSKTLAEVGEVLRAPMEDRLKITEYYIGKEDGEASWMRISNMTQGAQLSMYNTDLEFNGQRVPFPFMGIPKKQFVIIKSAGLASTIPSNSNDFGIVSTKYKEIEVLADDFKNGGELSLLFAWSPFQETETIDKVQYTADSCQGEITEYGSCKLNKPYLVWNDISDGFIN